MGTAELDAFLLLPHAREAMRQRGWDDDAKVYDLQPASSHHALQELEALMLRVLSG